MFKNLLYVGVSAGAGAFVGDKLFTLIDPHLPASVTPGARGAARIGTQAATGIALYSLLRGLF